MSTRDARRQVQKAAVHEAGVPTVDDDNPRVRIYFSDRHKLTARQAWMSDRIGRRATGDADIDFDEWRQTIWRTNNCNPHVRAWLYAETEDVG